MTPSAASWLKNSISFVFKTSSSLECLFHHCVCSQPLGKIHVNFQEPGQKNQEGFRRTYTTSINTTSPPSPAQPRAGGRQGCQRRAEMLERLRVREQLSAPRAAAKEIKNQKMTSQMERAWLPESPLEGKLPWKAVQPSSDCVPARDKLSLC